MAWSYRSNSSTNDVSNNIYNKVNNIENKIYEIDNRVQVIEEKEDVKDKIIERLVTE